MNVPLTPGIFHVTLTLAVTLGLVPWLGAWGTITSLCLFSLAVGWSFPIQKQVMNDAIPDSRLLVYSAGDGWEPLCRFLDVPVPAEAFPPLNDTAWYRARTTGFPAEYHPAYDHDQKRAPGIWLGRVRVDGSGECRDCRLSTDS